jgi:uncharacterized DUF497 family protein
VGDEPKRLANIAKHGLDFADLDAEFFYSAKILPVRSPRLVAVGDFEGFVVTTIFHPLGREAISIVSMRPASDKERRLV